MLKSTFDRKLTELQCISNVVQFQKEYSSKQKKLIKR